MGGRCRLHSRVLLSRWRGRRARLVHAAIQPEARNDSPPACHDGRRGGAPDGLTSPTAYLRAYRKAVERCQSRFSSAAPGSLLRRASRRAASICGCRARRLHPARTRRGGDARIQGVIRRRVPALGASAGDPLAVPAVHGDERRPHALEATEENLATARWRSVRHFAAARRTPHLAPSSSTGTGR